MKNKYPFMWYVCTIEKNPNDMGFFLATCYNHD